MLPLLGKFFDSNDREITNLSSTVKAINDLDSKIKN